MLRLGWAAESRVHDANIVGDVTKQSGGRRLGSNR